MSTQSLGRHCHFHRWRPVYQRQIFTGKRRGHWRWKYRCKECSHTSVFHTTYPPKSLGEREDRAAWQAFQANKTPAMSVQPR